MTYVIRYEFANCITRTYGPITFVGTGCSLDGTTCRRRCETRTGRHPGGGAAPLHDQSVDYCGTNFVPYLALMTPMISFAMSRCPAADGCTPSREINGPKVAVALLRFGNGGISPDARLATNSGFGSQ